MKITIYTLFVFTLLLSGCRSYDFFIEQRDYDVGRSIDLVSYECVKVLNDGTYDLYYFEWKNTGCKFVYYVNEENGIVESWDYVSSPDNCYYTSGGL